MSNESVDSSKIIIDEDWKSQAQREKEQLAAKQHETDEEERVHDPRLPPATLAVLATTLATQAAFALGHFPHPTTGETTVNLDEAHHFIETLAMLEQKTEGNRTAEESALLDNLLHELRIAFVSARPGKPVGAGV